LASYGGYGRTVQHGRLSSLATMLTVARGLCGTTTSRQHGPTLRRCHAELEVVKLVSEGLGNKEVAPRLFVSSRTVQAHLTHVYTKLGLTSRVQLAQGTARHA
jgi:DNA-binding NarL/FixJ family response regulator